ncbi:MAG: hypothetical protein OXF65_09555 [Acidimicrobiaceae bacterium]|nr:hypothetical protein [Acidimicrobiaceae bacterium]
MPTTPKQAATRRRDIGTLLVLCTLVSLVGAIVTGSFWALTVFALLLASATAFAVLVVRRHRSAPTAEVHYLPTRDAASSAVTMIRRQAN